MSELAAELAASTPLVIGRYALFDELAAGGMATVHLGRLLGPVGFGRTVAVKRLHAHFLKDEEFVTMFMDEARIVARIRHPNVVPMADVVQSDKGLFLVMEYVHGESLSRLMRTARKNEEPIPPRIVAAVMCGVLLGLHAAHDTKGTDGTLLGVVHRDVSPQNIIVGSDGAARVLDFGIAKAAGRAQVTREGQIKGKLAYMAPEQIRGQVDRRTDVFAAAVVLWEMLAGRRLHGDSKDVDIVTRVVKGDFAPPSQYVPALGPEVDAVVMRALASDPKLRYATARDFALELERTVGIASPSQVSEWVERLAKEVLEARASLVSAMELAANDLIAIDTQPPPPPSEPGAPGDIPVHLDEPGGPPFEVPSSSAVFAHTQTPSHLRAVARPPRRSSAGWMVVATSVLLALAGIALGAYALVHRARRSPPAIAVTPPAPPSAAATTPASASAEEPPPVTAAAPKATPSARPSASASAAVSARPRPVAPAPPERKPKPSCDPPYTVDEVGHRHYKPECD
ncbi:MAG TPA: serine/threonine-protein kinase [Labilithrix sp.]|nr:serine/threonine-protein kinase [Labilithrix sp.]